MSGFIGRRGLLERDVAAISTGLILDVAKVQKDLLGLAAKIIEAMRDTIRPVEFAPLRFGERQKFSGRWRERR